MGQLPDGVAVAVEHLERLVHVVGQQEATDRVDRHIRVDLVDPCLQGLRRVRLERVRRVDEPEQPPSSVLDAGREAQLAGRPGVELGRCQHVVERHRQGPAERVDEPQLHDRGGPSEDRHGQLVGHRALGVLVAHDDPLVADPEQLLPQPVERRGRQVERVEEVREVTQRHFVGVLELGARRVGQVSPVLRVQPLADAVRQRIPDTAMQR